MQNRWNIISGFVKENKARAIVAFVAAVLSSFLTILIPISIGKYYDLMFDYGSTRAQLLDVLPMWFFDTMPHFLLFFTALVVLRFAINYIERYHTAMLGELLVYKIRENLFQHQLHLKMSVYDQKGIGKYLLRYSGDLKSIQNYLTKGVIGFSRDIVLLLLSMGVVLMLDYRLGIVFLVALPPIFALMYVFNKRLYSISENRRNTRSGLLSYVNMRLRSVLTIKSFNKENPEIGRFHKRSEKLMERGKQYHKVASLIHAFIPTALYLMLGGILLLVFYQKSITGIVMNEGVLLTAVLLLITIMPVFRSVLRVTMVWKLGKISFSKLLAVLNLPQEDNHEKTDLILEDGHVSFSNLAFAYHESELLFHNLNLDFEPHKIYLIKGATGAGKSSLIKLMQGIYRPLEGQINIDGQNISEVNPKSLRKKIAVVSDEVTLLGKTVFEAISYSRKMEKRAAAEKMLDRVQKAIPERARLTIDDEIGELGNNLSAGQQKILSYARALLTRKPILVLDEPFMGLDKASCANLEQMIEHLKKKRTIIILSRGELSGAFQPDATYNLNDFKTGNQPVVRHMMAG